ncbi:uncharacterized protein ASPGLDRAFT_809880 [Aspergillus glaucus CBS 516.65]|uniref:Secreted protein n=1 Tax=Aspergillus glaucus CBS 516.65 TaxID=1160497 RepID=A0A1L9VAJ0_ASPGL|nr:hypothetical protein ASPGLDRAFT_809880 [Aspergillus glaucus CBS 516.65]OJJ80976.1 hypothetical protein ASPGLDRAFT_809880 [Aspergillus glaucus CBS 516.65]
MGALACCILVLSCQGLHESRPLVCKIPRRGHHDFLHVVESYLPPDYDCHSSSASTNYPVLSSSGSYYPAMVCVLVIRRATYTAVPPLRPSARHKLAWKGKEDKAGS